MNYLYSPYLPPLAIATFLAISITVVSTARRNNKSAQNLALIAAALTAWLIAYGFELSAPDLGSKIFWGKIQYFGISLIPLFWFSFSQFHVRNQNIFEKRFAPLLFLIPTITVALCLTTEKHGLIWKSAELIFEGGHPYLQVSYGPWFWVHTLYCYLLLLAGAGTIVRGLWKKRGVFQGQTIALLIAVVSPWISNILTITDKSPFPFLDLTPFAFTISVLATGWAIIGYKLTNLSPIAREFVLEKMDEGILVFDHNDQLTDFNPAAARLLNHEVQLTIGKTAQSVLFFNPNLLLDHKKGNTLPGQVKLKENPSQWIEVSCSTLRSKNEAAIGCVVTLRDITTQKRSQAQLNQLYRAVESSPTSIVITDPAGLIEYVNPKFCQVTGYRPEEVIGKSPRFLKTDLTPKETHTQMWRTIVSGQEWRGEFCNKKKNGEVFWEFASISPIKDASGSITNFVAVKEDITENKRSQELLEQSEQRYRQIVENASDLIYRLDRRGNFEYFNPPTLHLLGYLDEKTLLGQHFTELIVPEFRRQAQEAIDHQIDQAIFSTYQEFQAVSVSGQTVWLGQNMRLILENDAIVGLQGVARDITERKQAEQAMIAARDQALEASQIKSQLIAKVSHELRTPLGAIIGFSELLKYGHFGAQNDQQLEASELILENGQFLNSLVNDLLDEAQLSAQKVVLNIEKISLPLLLQNVEANMSVLAAKKGLQLSFSAAPDFPDPLLADEQRLRQILVNLVANAIKFTPSGGIQVSAEQHNMTHWFLRVSDTGIGIPQEALTTIFDPFSQVKNPLQFQNRGTGLGLTITKQLIELMGGKILVESEIDHGTTFTVVLPILDTLEKPRAKTARLNSRR